MFILNTIILFEIIIIAHELGHFLAAKFLKVGVFEFSIGFGPKILGFSKKGIRYCLRAFFFGGFVSFKDDEEFLKTSIFKRMAIIFSGPFANILLGFLSIAAVLLIQGKFNSTEVFSVKDYCTKIEVGDEIIAVNGKNILCSNDFLYKLSRIKVDEPINLKVRRNIKEIELLDVGRIFKNNNIKKKSLGISLKVKKLTFFNFFKEGFNNFLFVIKMIFSAIFSLFNGRASLKEFSGPVGLFKTVGEAEKNGICSLIFLFAFLSINIGLVNLFPLFALDGGQLLFLFYELIFKRKVKKEHQNILNNISFFVLIFLLILITIKDIYSLFFI